jgi:hypothetical protein
MLLLCQTALCYEQKHSLPGGHAENSGRTCHRCIDAHSVMPRLNCYC